MSTLCQLIDVTGRLVDAAKKWASEHSKLQTSTSEMKLTLLNGPSSGDLMTPIVSVTASISVRNLF